MSSKFGDINQEILVNILSVIVRFEYDWPIFILTLFYHTNILKIKFDNNFSVYLYWENFNLPILLCFKDTIEPLVDGLIHTSLPIKEMKAKSCIFLMIRIRDTTKASPISKNTTMRSVTKPKLFLNKDLMYRQAITCI